MRLSIRTIQCLLLCAIWFLQTAAADEVPLPTIRKVWLDTNETPVNLGSDSWTNISYKEFQRVLTQAELINQAEKNPPWITQAHYEASIKNQVLTGKALLHINNPHAIKAWTTLYPWSPAIVAAKNGNPARLRTGETLQHLRALIEPNRVQPLEIDFSVMGEQRGDGTYFQFQLPSCTVATMQIQLPSGYRLDWPGNGQYLNGPFGIADSQARSWNLTLGGQPRRDIQLVIREDKNKQFSRWMESRLDADFVVGQREVQANYEIELQSWHDRLRSVIIDWPESISVDSIQLKKLDADLPVSAERMSPSQIKLKLPDSIEHRATIQIKGKWKFANNQRIDFRTPAIQESQLTRSSIRIVSSYDVPLIDWEWGDYLPTQAPQKVFSLDAGAEILTLTPRILIGNKSGKVPSARLAVRNNDINYVEHNWWNLGRQKSELIVQYRCSVSQGSMDFLSWRVPEGWQVKDVIMEPSTRLYAWNWQPGKLLNVQLNKPIVPGQQASLLFKLVSVQPPQFSEEPRVEYLPRLIPVVQGALTGSYALSFERSHAYLPPSFQIVKAPGMRVTPPTDNSGLWSSQLPIPDCYWQLQELQASGTIQWQDWGGSSQVQLRTEVQEASSGFELYYRATIRPRTGRVTQLPIRFTQPVQNLIWKSSTSINNPFRWNMTTSAEGKLEWEAPIVEETLLEARLPWRADQPIPILVADLTNDIRLKVDASLEAAWNSDDQASVIRDAKEPQSWLLHTGVHSPRLSRKKPTVEILQDPKLTTELKNGYSENLYTVRIAACSNPLTVVIPPHAWLTEALLDMETLEINSRVSIPASGRNRELKLRYRQPIQSNFIYSRYDPAYPSWPSIHSVPIRHDVQFNQRVFSCNEWNGESIETESVQLSTKQSNSLYWISLEKYLVLLSSTFVGSFLICRFFSKWYIACVMLIMILATVFLPVHWWLVPVSGLLGISVQWGLKALRSRYAVLLLASTVMFAMGHSWTLASDDQATELVFVIPDSAGNRENARVMVPAKLWTLLQSKAAQTGAGSHRSWWISEVHSTGELGLQQLRLTTQWNVFVEGNEAIDIPWVEGKPPQAVRLNGVLVQPRLVQGPFGLQQFAFRIKEPGEHTLQIDWEIKTQSFRGMESVLIKWPGAPVQTLSLKNMPNDTQVSGTAGSWSIREENQRYRLDVVVGSVTSLNLSWFSSSKNIRHAVVDAGVLWEHRATESTAHAVISYHLDNVWLDKMTINIPLHTRIRNLNVAGDLQTNLTPRIRQWTITKDLDKQQLNIQLQQPIRGQCVLLLELPWQRNLADEKVPLYGIEVMGAEIRNSFVAYLLDGVVGKPDRELVPVPKGTADFARPWLPSLGALPSNSFTKMADFRVVIPSIQIQPAILGTNVQTSLNIQLDMQEAEYRYVVSAIDRNVPVLYLTAQVDPGFKIQEVTGDNVVRWHQTSVQTSGPSRLYIWLRGKKQADQSQLCTITGRKPIEQMDRGRSHIPLFAIKWEGIQSGPQMPVTLRSIRANRWNLESSSPGLIEQTGPNLDADILSKWIMPFSMPYGSMIVMREEQRKQIPSLTRHWDENEKCWRFTLQASADETIPAELELAVQNGKLEDDWQFEANVPLVSRPVRGQKGELLWSLQLQRPVKSLQFKVKPAAHSEGKRTEPAISFLAWPGLVSP